MEAETTLIGRCAACGSTLWIRFPKFTLGFLATSLILSLALEGDLHAHAASWSFSLSEWFSTLGFVGIGLNLRLRAMWGKANAADAGKGVSDPNAAGASIFQILALYCIGQSIDLVTTAAVAYYSFSGVDPDSH